MAHHLTREQARRIAVTAQLLTAERPTSLIELVRHLTLLQVEPTAAVAPSADVVAWSRLGAGYSPAELDEQQRAGVLVELRQMIRPAEDLALYTAEMAAWPGVGQLTDWQIARRDWVIANDECRREILEKLYDEGPLPATELPDTTTIPWESSGWNNDRSLRMLLEMMVARGEVALAGRDGRLPLWDLAERVYPDVAPVPLTDALRLRAARRLRALGIARAKAPQQPGEPIDVADAGEAAVVEGVRGQWRVDPSYLAMLDTELCGRAALLSPLDRLVMDRKRLVDLFEFDYQLEMYKPAAQRRWGYWAMPVLWGDRLVGKLDATADRAAGVLRVTALHEDDPWPPEVLAAVTAEVAALADWLGLVRSGPDPGAG